MKETWGGEIELYLDSNSLQVKKKMEKPAGIFKIHSAVALLVGCELISREKWKSEVTVTKKLKIKKKTKADKRTDPFFLA